MKIYLAGKIEKHCWRSSLAVDGHRFGGLDIDEYEEEWPVGKNSVVGEHDYVGPYFVSDDHSCGHGPSSHGASEDSPCLEYEKSGEAHRRGIVAKCLGAIRRADAIFAWIDSNDAHGTVFEIGYAVAIGKRVLLAFHERFEPKPIQLPDESDERNFDRRGLNSIDGGFDQWFAFTAVPERDRCFASSARAGFDRLMNHTSK
jgi:nucleoside 2-deoxyribosyltransferase